MDIQPENSLLSNIQLDNLFTYLTLTGWERVFATNPRYSVFRGELDINDDPLEIVMVTNSNARDYAGYLASAVNSLSQLQKVSPEDIIRRIEYYDRDLLTVKNIETGEYQSVALATASTQVQKLKQLVAYSACSEYEPRPHYNEASISLAKRMVRHYRFGHTLRGSFSYTIESELRQERYVPSHSQLPLLHELQMDDDEIEILPVERRVMERIARGLWNTKQAAREHNITLLVESFGSGFNSTMCRSISGIAGEGKSPIEYAFQWSPRITPSEEVIENESFILTERDYSYLEDAATELREYQPEYVLIQGKVRALSSSGDPFGSYTTERSIVVQWENKPTGRSPGVFVTLSRKDYEDAIRAHEKWLTVQVTGSVQKVSNYWRLSDAADFRIVE